MSNIKKYKTIGETLLFLYSISSRIFSPNNKQWLGKIDKLKTFDDVVNLAKLMLEWQQKEVDKLKKLPDFDLHKIADNYDLNEKDDNEDEESNETSDSDNGESQESEDNGEDKKDSGEQTAVNSEAQEGGGEGISPDNLVSITNDTMEDKMSKLYDNKKSYAYYTLPKVRLNDMIISNDKFLNMMRKHIIDQTKKWDNKNIKEQSAGLYMGRMKPDELRKKKPFIMTRLWHLH